MALLVRDAAIEEQAPQGEVFAAFEHEMLTRSKTTLHKFIAYNQRPSFRGLLATSSSKHRSMAEKVIEQDTMAS